ncbi:DNA photolyase [Haematococcus lacustris]
MAVEASPDTLYPPLASILSAARGGVPAYLAREDRPRVPAGGRTHAGRLPALHPTQTHHTETTVAVRQTSCSSMQQIKAKGTPHVNKRGPAKGPAPRHLVMGAALYAVSRLAATLVRGAWQHWRGPQLSPGAPSLVWLRSDLRLQDHEPLRHACLQGGPVLLVYCFDPRDYSKSCTGFSPTSHQRASFLLDCLADLRHQLRARGADLILRRGQPEQVLPRLLVELGARRVLCHWEAAPEEQQVERAVAQAVAAEGGQLLGFWGASTLHHTLDMPFQLDSMPATYTAFCDAVKGIPVRPPCPAPDTFSLPTSAGSLTHVGRLPTLPELGFPSPSPAANGPLTGLRGGETEGLQQLAHWTWQGAARLCGGGQEQQQRQQQRGQQGQGQQQQQSGAPVQQISPWLALGCLSPRQVYRQLQQQVQQAGTDSWVVMELLWRDYFRLLAMKHHTPMHDDWRQRHTADPGGVPLCV